MSGSRLVWVNRAFARETIIALCVAAGLALAIALLPWAWATMIVLGGILLVATLVHPQIGVLLLVPAVPFGSLRQLSLGFANVGISEVLVALVVSACSMAASSPALTACDSALTGGLSMVITATSPCSCRDTGWLMEGSLFQESKQPWIMPIN